MKSFTVFSCVNQMINILGPVSVDGMIIFNPLLVGMAYGLADSVLKTAGVIVSAKCPCNPPPRLVWTEDALRFRIPWTLAMVS